MNNEDLLNRIVHLMQTDNSADAPRDAVNWSKNIFRTRAAAPKESVVRRVLAVLQIDLAPGKAVFGERSASASQVRQMLFAAGEHQLDLRVAQVDKKFKLSGQILGEGFANAEIKLTGAEKSYTAKSNELSEFQVERITKGTYTLLLKSGIREILIENIEIS